MDDSKQENQPGVSSKGDKSNSCNLTVKSDQYDTENAEYDPFAERRVANPTSDAGALSHLLKCSLGSGILAMPNAFKNGGLTFSMVFTILVGALCTHCVHILVKSSHIVCKKVKRPSLNFAETAEQAFATGPPSLRKLAGFGKTFTNVALVATYYGALAVYVVFVAESFKKVAEANIETVLDIRIWIAMLVVPLTILSLIRDLKYLVPFSWLANCFVVIGFAITLYYMFIDYKDPAGLPHVGTASHLPLFFSTVIFAMEGIGVVMPVENSMKNPSHFLGPYGILNISMSVVVTLYTVIGFFGYLAYRECTDASITFNLPEGQIKTQVVQMAVGLAIMFTYPLQFYIGSEITLGILKDYIRKEKFNCFQYIYRVTIVVLTVGIAAAVPNLGPIISLVGAICFSILGLLIPAVIETLVCYDGLLGRGNWILIKNVIISIVAIIALILGTYASMLEIINAYSSSNDGGLHNECKTKSSVFS